MTPELHSAGATVSHRSPFEDLVVPVSTEPLDAGLRDRWVKPFYISFPHNLSEAAPVLQSQFQEISPELIQALLANFNWRPRICGAFLVALDQRVDFENQIGTLLLRSDVCYAGEGYCLALARLNTPGAVDFLKTYLRYYLTRPDLYFDQQSALAALRHLDQVNGTSHAREFDQLWLGFVHDKPSWDLDQSCARFTAAIREIESVRSICPPRSEPVP